MACLYASVPALSLDFPVLVLPSACTAPAPHGTSAQGAGPQGPATALTPAPSLHQHYIPSGQLLTAR